MNKKILHVDNIFNSSQNDVFSSRYYSAPKEFNRDIYFVNYISNGSFLTADEITNRLSLLEELNDFFEEKNEDLISIANDVKNVRTKFNGYNINNAGFYVDIIRSYNKLKGNLKKANENFGLNIPIPVNTFNAEFDKVVQLELESANEKLELLIKDCPQGLFELYK